ncbi:MAG: hypothetical protein ACP5GH_01385 [Nitrososphaeria archaeon]
MNFNVNKKSKLQPNELLDEALKIIKIAQNNGITIRLFGGLAIYYLLKEKNNSFFSIYSSARKADSESFFGDIDFVAYSKQSKMINDLFLNQLKFEKDKVINSLFGDKRRIYYHPYELYHIDIFFDKLEFNHKIDIQNRLEMSYPTLNFADLLLSKLQVHYITQKDIIDLQGLIAIAHDIQEPWKERVYQILSDDWGFYYDAVNNLKAALSYTETLNEELQVALTQIINEIINTPKTKNWIKRSKTGTNKKWWDDAVEEVKSYTPLS